MSRFKLAKVQPQSNPIAGTGRLVVEGWSSPATGLQIALEGNQGLGYLQQDQQWRSTEFWFDCPFELQPQSGQLSVDIGAFLVNALLLKDSNVTCKLWLRSSANPEIKAVGRFMLEDGLEPSTAQGQGVESMFIGKLGGIDGGVVKNPPLPERVVEPEPPVVPEVPVPQEPPVVAEPPAQPAPLAPPVPPVTQKPKGKSLLWLWILLGVLAAAAIGGAVWWFMLKPASAEPEAEPQPAPPAAVPAPVAAAPCSVQAMQSGSELEFVQACLAQTQSSEELLQVIEQAKQADAANACGIAVRMYANRAQSGDLAIAQAYAKEYDPQFFQASKCFEQANPETAAYWWETILGFDAQHELAAQRLKELKP